MTVELKPCPFCGGEVFAYHSGLNFELCEVICKECGCRTKRRTAVEAIKAWNTRKPIEGIVERLETHAIEFEAFGQCSDYVELTHAIEIVKGGGSGD